MRYLSLIPLLFITLLSLAQKPSFEKLESDFCNCLTGTPGITLNSKEYQQCLTKTLEKYQQLMIQEGKDKYGDSAKKVRPEIFFNYFYQKLTLRMIRSCTFYFTMTDDARTSYYYSKDLNTLRDELAARMKLERRLSGNYFWYRSEIYLRLGDYKNALIDADSSIRDKPHDCRGYYIKGYVKERLGKYDEALYLYQKADAVQPDFQNKMAIAIVKKKIELRSSGK